MTGLDSSAMPFDQHGLVVLVDPGRSTPADAYALATRAAREGACGLLIGDSITSGRSITAHVAALRAAAPALRIVQFPASADDLCPDVDAVLFLSLLSGRNPRYLIEEQVRAVPFFDSHPAVTPISTAYLLIDGGRESAVQSVTRTHPLPSNDPSLVAAHVRAGSLLGMRATYLEAGSGAARPIGADIIAAAREATGGPLFVGGGITTESSARVARDAGADYVVVGTLFEREPAAHVRALATAARA